MQYPIRNCGAVADSGANYNTVRKPLDVFNETWVTIGNDDMFDKHHITYAQLLLSTVMVDPDAIVQITEIIYI